MSIRPLTPALAEKARVELNEDPARLHEDLQHLKDWIAKQPHLRARTDDQWLVVFLRGCKYSLERTKEKLDLYYAARTAAMVLLRVQHTDPVIHEFIKDGGFILLPKLAAPDAPRVAITRMDRIDVSKYSFGDVMGSVIILEKIALMEDDHLTVGGAVMVLDCKGMSIAHFTQITPSFLKKVSFIGQDASPIRMKGVHLLNAPTGAETFFNLLKSFVSEKNRDRFHVHSSLEDLYKHIPKDIMPAEYGGNGGTTEEIVGMFVDLAQLLHESWINNTKKHKAFLTEEVNYGTDEHKRPGKPKTAEEMFGVDGSFRKLEFD